MATSGRRRSDSHGRADKIGGVPSTMRTSFPDTSEYEKLLSAGGLHVGNSATEHRVHVRAFAPPVLINSEQNRATIAALTQNVADSVEQRHAYKRAQKREAREKEERERALAERMLNDKHLQSPSPAEISDAFDTMQTTASFIRSVFTRDGDKDARVSTAARELSIERSRILREAYREESTPELSKAHAALVGCLAMIDVTSNLVNSDKESIEYCNKIVAAYLHRNGAPFSWKSSSSLVTGPTPCIYETYVPREHCIMLAWRAAMIAVRTAMCIFDPTGDLRSIFEVDEAEYGRRRKDAVYLIVYALNLLRQVVPAQIRSLYGSIYNESLSPAAAAMPEFRPGVLDAMIKIILSLLEQVVLRQTDIQSIFKSSTGDFKWLSASQRYDRYSGQESAISGERILCSKLQACSIKGATPKMTNSMRALVFVQNVDALKTLTTDVWTGHLEDMMRDFRFDNDLEARGQYMMRYFGSQTHRVAYSWTRDSIDVRASETLKRDSNGAADEQIACMYNAADSSRALRNLIVGTSIYQECVMMARELHDIDVSDACAVARASVLAQKVETLFSPIYGRRRSALELAAWIVTEMRDRCQMCFEANDVLMCNEAVHERGVHLSGIRSFTQTSLQREAAHRIMVNALRREGKDVSMQNTGLQDPFDTRSMSSASGNGVNTRAAISSAANVLFSQFKQKVLYGSMVDASDDGYPQYDSASAAAKKRDDHQDEMVATIGIAKTQRIVPFCDEDIDLWESIMGVYDTRYYGSPQNSEKRPAVYELQGRLHTFTSVAPNMWMPNAVSELYSTINTNIISDVATLASPYYDASPAMRQKTKLRRRAATKRQ